MIHTSAADIQKYLQYSKSILGIMEQLRSNVPKKESCKVYQWMILGLVEKAYKTGCAMQILLAAGYSEDAYVLLRSLMETVINVGWILNDKREEIIADRCQRFLDDVEFSKFSQLHRMLQFQDELDTMGLESNERDTASAFKGELQKALEGKRDRIAKLEKRYGIIWREYKRQVLPTIATRAQECGLKLEYLSVFWMASDFVHSSAMSLNQYQDYNKNGVGIITGPNYGLVPRVALSMIRFLFALANCVNEDVSLGIDSQLRDFEADYLKTLPHLTENG